MLLHGAVIQNGVVHDYITDFQSFQDLLHLWKHIGPMAAFKQKSPQKGDEGGQELAFLLHQVLRMWLYLLVLEQCHLGLAAYNMEDSLLGFTTGTTGAHQSVGSLTPV